MFLSRIYVKQKGTCGLAGGAVHSSEALLPSTPTTTGLPGERGTHDPVILFDYRRDIHSRSPNENKSLIQRK